MHDSVVIPVWVVDLDSFRRWARSTDFPGGGHFSFLDCDIWVDPNNEELFSENQVKGAFAATLGRFSELGYCFMKGALWSHPGANFSTEPDLFFVAYDSIRSDRARFVDDKDYGSVELEGTADMALEIVGDRSETRDVIVLKRLYAKSGVREYWLVDARGSDPRFEIWCLHDGAYQAAVSEDGWLTSAVFGKAFKLQQDKDPLGHPSFQLLVR